MSFVQQPILPSANPAAPDVTEDAVLGGALRLRQPRRGHRVGHDAILLAASCPLEPGDSVVDLGAGVGAVGLALAARAPGIAVTLVEIDPQLAALAADNARLNGLADRARSLALDVRAPARAFAAAGLSAQSVARVVMNPPFNDAARQQSSQDLGRRRAHAASRGGLAGWIAAASRLLKPRGTLSLIFRADGLADVLCVTDPAFGALTVQPVYPSADTAAIRILVRATKGGRAPLTLLPGLVLNDSEGRPTAEAEAVLRRGGLLPLAREGVRRQQQP
jgi:tRNA1(Val) A37 N6-methylase TrmN6